MTFNHNIYIQVNNLCMTLHMYQYSSCISKSKPLLRMHASERVKGFMISDVPYMLNAI